MVTIQINGNEYPLATNLRVAYLLQNQHNHEAYSSILSRVGDMPLEQQLDLIYVAFSVANPDTAKTFSKEMFRTYIFDHMEFNATVIMNFIRDIIAGILGTDLSEVTETDASATSVHTGVAKN